MSPFTLGAVLATLIVAVQDFPGAWAFAAGLACIAVVLHFLDALGPGEPPREPTGAGDE